MKYTFVFAAVLVLAGCSSTTKKTEQESEKTVARAPIVTTEPTSQLLSPATAVTTTTTSPAASPPIEPLRHQKLSSTFDGETVKIETDCVWITPNDKQCQIVAIEAIGIAVTNGNSDMNKRTAFIRASDKARANVRHFIQEDVSSTRVQNTFAKNVEKASDKLKSRTSNGEIVSMSDEEAEKDSNITVRGNSNDTAHSLTETIRVNAQGILRGFRIVKQEIIGSQEVATIIRWDRDSEKASEMLRKKFSN